MFTAQSRRRYILASLAGLLIATTALSTVATQHVAAKLQHHPALGRTVAGIYAPWNWVTWQSEAWAGGVRKAFEVPNNIAVGLSALFAFGAAASTVKRKNKVEPHDNVHGSAHFATFDDVRDMGLLGHSQGIYIGAIEERKAGVVHYIRDTSRAHIAGIAPTRSGKGLGLVLPNLLSYTESVVVLDYKGELWEMTSGWRKSIGQRVIRWQPGHPTASARFNFLDEVRVGTEHETKDAQNIAMMLIDADGKGLKDHWDRTAFGFLTGVILHVIYSGRQSGRPASLAVVAAILSSPALKPDDLYNVMANNKALSGGCHPVIAAAGVDQISREGRERGSVLSTAKTYLSLFLDPLIARNCEVSDFRLADLMDGDVPASLYLMVPGEDAVRLRPLVRLLITMIAARVTSVPPRMDANMRQLPPHKHHMLLMLDEFPTLGKMPVFESGLAVWAGFWVQAFLIMQDREQLISAYGPHSTILSNIRTICAYAPNELTTAEWLSKMLGQRTVNYRHTSESGMRGTSLRQVSRSYTAIPRPLLSPDEVRNLPEAVKEGDKVVSPGQSLILITGRTPILGRQILFFQDSTFVERSRLGAA